MSQQGSHEPTQSHVHSTAHIDQVCDEFEKACGAGRPPLIEEVLMRAPPDERDRLLAELLEIELDCRQRLGTFLQVEEYRGRFPDSLEMVDSVFRRVVKTRRLADYELLEELGHGGMGVVYKARQIYLEQIVAVKILPHRYLDDAQAVSRFRREMQSIGALNHPNIVRAYNAGEAGGVHFLVMEFVDGLNLQRFIAGGKGDSPHLPERPVGCCAQMGTVPFSAPVGVGAACEIVRQAALGLQHAHEHQLVHRDIKPANLMLARDGQTKILDLGLAKFHAETRGDAKAQGQLTQPGITLGTIDYMAPEQWENSATADIRADIYSLGCTLFFLLTGKTPYGDPPYGSNRKKLMAHAVAPIPSLLENCADVPQELQEVYERMLAKNPEDRYATPVEVAEAVAEFADPEELAEVIAALPPPGVGEAADNTGVQGRGADTPRRASGSAGSLPRRRSMNRWMSRQKLRRNLTIGIAAGLTTALCMLAAWAVIWSHDGRRGGDRPHGSSAAPISSISSGAPATPVSREPLAAELALLPGLNGRWWFEQMPWLTPFVRQAIAERVLASPDLASVLGGSVDGRSTAGPQGYLHTNTAEAQKWLWEAVARCRGTLSPCQRELLDQLSAMSYEQSDRRGRRAMSNEPGSKLMAQSSMLNAQSSKLRAALQQFTAGHQEVAWSAADLHTLALLQHAIAMRDNDKALAAEAKKSYDKALDAYAAQPKGRLSTQLLCLVDSAVLCETVLSDPKEAKRRMDEALAEKNLPVLFHVSLLVERGRIAAATAASPGEYEDHRFVYAKKLLDGCDAIKPVHPLAAYVAECYAASLADQWKVDEANKQFQAAYHIRLTNKEEKAPPTTGTWCPAIYVFQDRRGSATMARYRGNLDSARRSFKSLVEEIQAAVDDASRRRGPALQVDDLPLLREQLAAAREAWADCELYGGAASGGRVNLSQAADCYEQARKLAADPADARRPLRSDAQGCKLALVRALAGKQSVAAEIVAQSRADQRQPLGAGQQRATLALQLAEAVLAQTGPTPADGRKLLRAFLDQFKLNPVSCDPHRREIVEMRLFAAELLLTSDIDDDPKIARKDRKYLDALLAVFQGRRDMRPYLRRYYELAVRACGKTDLVQIAQYVLDSRMVQREAAPAARPTLVLFSFTTKENFAVFLPQDGQQGKRFELDVTRDQIKSSKGKPLHLNDNLVALIKSEIAAGRPLEVFWDDTASRPSEDPDALTDGDWPFDHQLELGPLRAKADSR